METALIVTHAGSAHFDEVMAIGLVVATQTSVSFHVERREPSEAELQDPSVWVIDVGDRHEPAKRNFDHHQDVAAPASFVLVADYLGLTGTLSILPWWRFKDSVDRIGPARSSVEFDAGDELVTRNPVETWLCASFASDPQTSLPMLKAFGEHVIKEAALLKQQIDFWKECPRLMIAGVPAIIGETTESAGLEEFRRLVPNPPDIVISLDRRGGGWRLFRYDGTPVDFRRIADSPAIAFVHNSGFLAKTRERIAVNELVKLVERAVMRQAD